MNLFLETLLVILMSLYDLLEALVLSCIPAKYHAKNVAGQNVLVTGAGTKSFY